MSENVLTPNRDNATCQVLAAVQAFKTSGQRPTGRALTAALLSLEKTAKMQRLTIPEPSLLGTWRLCFSAGKRAKYQSGQPVGSGFYIPKWAIARITFAANDTADSPLTVTNQLSIGPLTVRFTGPARYPGKKNLLAFDFAQLTLVCFGVTVYRGAIGGKKSASTSFAERAIAQLPFFAFFAATDEFIAARGRGGGLAIWVRQS